jgi:phospholipase C
VYVEGYAARTAADQGDAAQSARVPMLAMPRFRDDPALASGIVDLDEYYTDLQNGTLPSVAFVVPSGSSSEHPPANVRAGQAFVRSLVNELMRSSAWSTSAFLWSYDDSGGSYDHVAPPTGDPAGYGFRVPALMVSPYAKQGAIDSTPLDATSALAFISQNWGVAPLGRRDASAPSLDSAFDFTQPPRAATLVSDVRVAPAARGVTTTALYPSYGLALLLPAAVVALTVLRSRRNEAAAEEAAA